MAVLIRLDILLLPSALVAYNVNPQLEVQRCKVKLVIGNCDILNVYNPGRVSVTENEFRHYFNQLDSPKFLGILMLIMLDGVNQE